MTDFQEAFRRAALAIAREVQQRALYARDGGIYWTQPILSQTNSAPPRPLDPYLYPGTMGIALFFALVSRVLEIREYGQLALQTVEPLRRELRDLVLFPERARRIRRPIGGFVGLGSLVYGLVRLGDLLDNPLLWNEALELSMLISTEQISEDAPREIMTGTAGALLALLALDARRPEANPLGYEPLVLALRAADSLMRNCTSWIGRMDGPADQKAEPVSIGFCHGASGIVYALSRLARRTGRADIRGVAQEGWIYIETAYDSQMESWRLPDRGGISGNSWCNGAAGILLGGLERGSYDSASLDTALSGTIKALELSPLDEHDHLCCGNMGRIDVLIHASGRLSNPGIMEAALSLAMRVLERARREGRYRLMFYPKGSSDLRLFPGLAGIGYAFLRLAAPEVLPSLLALA